MPEPRLVRRDHRPPEVLLQRLEDRHAAKVGACDQNAVCLGGAGGAYLGTERLGLLLEAQALADEILRRQVPPLAAGIEAMEGGRRGPGIGVVADGGLHRALDPVLVVPKPALRRPSRKCFRSPTFLYLSARILAKSRSLTGDGSPF